jgi:thymidylate synthase
VNNIDKHYQQLLQDIIDNGTSKSDRTGTGTISVFGRQIRHKMSEGFPLLTTKKMAFKTMVVELLWFLRGDTNIKFLLDYDCHIWDGDAYKGYEKECVIHKVEPLPKERFIEAIKNGNNKEPHFIPDSTGYKLGDLGPIYGKQWRSWREGKYTNELIVDSLNFPNGPTYWKEGIDQIENLINELKTNPDSRRLMVNAWNVGELDQMVLPPCHYGFQVYTRELSGEERWELLEKKVGKEVFKSMVDDIVPFGGGLSEELQSNNIPKRAISLMWNQRSVDTFLGLPFNIASYGLLLEIIAKEVNMVPDELIGNLGDTHLYLNHIEQAKEQIGRTPYELPSITITERNWYMHEKVKEHLGEKTLDEKLKSYRPDCFELIDYISHPKIKAPLSN